MRTVAFLFLVSVAIAAPPSKMNRESAARLDRALSHLRELHNEAKFYEDEMLEVCKAHQIEPQDLNRNVVVDFQTGDIIRKPSPAPVSKK